MIYEISVFGWEESYHILVDSKLSLKELKPKIDNFIIEAIKSKIKKEKESKRKLKSYICKADILKELQIILKNNGFVVIIPKHIGYALTSELYNNYDDDLPGKDLVVNYNKTIDKLYFSVI